MVGKEKQPRVKTRQYNGETQDMEPGNLRFWRNQMWTCTKLDKGITGEHMRRVKQETGANPKRVA